MEAWVYPTDLAGWKIILNQTATIPDGFERTFIGALNAEIEFGVNGGSFVDTNVSLLTNRWQHLALTATGSTIKVFLDGVEVHSTTGYSRVGTAGPAFHLGGSHVSNEYWVGSIDQVKVWDAALSQADIERSMHTYSSSGIAHSLYAHFDFNAVTTGLELDETGNGRHLTLDAGVSSS
ncbi:MAG: LamG domain-containing protein, partial [Pontimonas sp.]|nr:LamG domain-containing protein [Pontimonas sp.]